MEIMLKLIFSLEFTIAIELGLILFHMPTKESIEEILKGNEGAHTTRREVRGTFGNPFEDTYKKNSRGQLKPVYPGSRMIDRLGDEEDDL